MASYTLTSNVSEVGCASTHMCLHACTRARARSRSFSPSPTLSHTQIPSLARPPPLTCTLPLGCSLLLPDQGREGRWHKGECATAAPAGECAAAAPAGERTAAKPTANQMRVLKILSSLPLLTTGGAWQRRNSFARPGRWQLPCGPQCRAMLQLSMAYTGHRALFAGGLFQGAGVLIRWGTFPRRWCTPAPWKSPPANNARCPA